MRNADFESNEGRPTAGGFETKPDLTDERNTGERQVLANAPFVNVTAEAAHALVETLFSGTRKEIHNVRYAIAYQLAQGRSGGDIVDVFHYDNDHVSLSIADIAGKGVQAAVHASMIKYGLRALASIGQTPENVMRGLDRLYLENNAFEQTPDSFATVFFGVVDASRRYLQYANAGHEPVMIVRGNGAVEMLAPTCPLVGVFEDQHHLFKQRATTLDEDCLLILTTDGVSEARSEKNELFGIARIGTVAAASRAKPVSAIATDILSEVEAFSGPRKRDDIAILVTRFS